MKPIIAIVGRPNVGKSTLFNRITRTREALVDDAPGVTRDRHYRDASWDEVEFTLVDTGGFVELDEDAFALKIREQVLQTIEDADAVIFVLDGKGGISPYDREMAHILRTVEKPVFYTVNKIDSVEQEENLFEFYSLGVEKLYPLSAEHKYGVPDFLDALVATFPAQASPKATDMVKVAVAGRPNAGKSSLINRLLGEDRLVVSDVPGTTRDAIDSVCRFDGKPYLLIDTAGIRRKGKVSKKIEKFSIIKALRSLDRCDVALIVIDAEEGITDQDISVAGYAHDRGCGCVFLLNKWDLVVKDNSTVKRYYERLRREAKFLQFAPAVTISALTGQRVNRIFKLVDAVYAQYATRISTGPLNKIIERAVQRNEPSLHKGKRLKFYFATQVATKPPTFVLFVNYPEAVHFSYRRYLTNKIREGAGLDITPVKVMFRQRTGAIDFGSRKKKAGRRSKKGRKRK